VISGVCRKTYVIGKKHGRIKPEGTMAKYRTTDAAAGQGLFLSVNLQAQLLPGSFEQMLNEITGTKIDLSIFDKKYKNDLSGAAAVPPAVLLKLIIYGYYNGCISSRKIYELNKNNIIAKALTGDMSIHWTTIADFVSENSEAAKAIFVQVLMYCNELGLIGGENFAIDGLRLPSNASIDMSGTEEQLKKHLSACQKMAAKHIERHGRKDAQGMHDEETEKRYEKRQRHLNRKIETISSFLAKMEKREGRNGKEIQSNVTDNESAMIHSSKGFLQGYIGIAVSDQKRQIITSAQAFGSANETEHMPEMLDTNKENMEEAGIKTDESTIPTIRGDANYFSEENLKACKDRGAEAIIPDSQAKRRLGPDGKNRYGIDDFEYNEEDNSYRCPQGKCLEHKRTTEQGGVRGEVYQASLTDCKACPEFSKCSWSRKAQSGQVQGKTIRITESNKQGNLKREMRKKFETAECQDKYADRIQIIEPVFANIRYCKGLNRFTLRGKEKVHSQWLMYCIVHNLGKCMNGLNALKNSA
jgi:transposase